MNDSVQYDVAADLGDMGCGDLVIALAQAMQPLRVDQVLQVRATDSGAREDIPAWCNMRGHTLLRAEQEIYYIQKGEH
ncbi:MAG: sulfurtransferase TusA family protein [Chloroflexi bacterium]|nr:sulfurtransferase TusA family protein [Chloroflexota bacterium]